MGIKRLVRDNEVNLAIGNRSRVIDARKPHFTTTRAPILYVALRTLLLYAIARGIHPYKYIQPMLPDTILRSHLNM